MIRNIVNGGDGSDDRSPSGGSSSRNSLDIIVLELVKTVEVVTIPIDIIVVVEVTGVCVVLVV